MIRRLLKRSADYIRNRLAPGNEDNSFFIPVLCYHSWTISGLTYETNDHVALEQDLQMLARRGYQIFPVTDLVALLKGNLPRKNIRGKKLVCITCDDGRDFDYYDCDTADWGSIPGFHGILQRSKAWLPQFSDGPRAVSFVIASPEARVDLDRACGNGKGEWRDSWWKDSAESGVLGIANHSWDHVHDSLAQVRQKDNKKGSFFEITTFDDAEAQIADAQQFIAEKTDNHCQPVFGYPYGHVSAYLRDEYFPQHGDRLGIDAAFDTDGTSVRQDSCIWSIPRFVCGFHWKTPEDFNALLDAVERGER